MKYTGEMQQAVYITGEQTMVVALLSLQDVSQSAFLTLTPCAVASCGLLVMPVKLAV
jgi:hypothetical protein